MMLVVMTFMVTMIVRHIIISVFIVVVVIVGIDAIIWMWVVSALWIVLRMLGVVCLVLCLFAGFLAFAPLHSSLLE